MPRAESCCDVPIVKAAPDGDTKICVSAFGSTVTAPEPDIPDNVAEMVACPVATLLTSPPEETFATDELDEDQAAVEVTSFVEPSLYFPVAVSCWF